MRLRTSSERSEYSRAAHESAPIEVWETLITEYPDMRFWVAQNKTVPLEILQRLASDPDARVRDMVARKRKLDPATLEKLSNDDDGGVRLTVARHSRTPTEVLQRLTQDSWSSVADLARRRLSTDDEE